MHRKRIKSKILFFVPLPPPVHGAALRNKSLLESKAINAEFDIRVIPFNFVDNINDIGKLSFLKIAKLVSRTITIIYRMISERPDLVYFNFSVYGFALYRDFWFALLFKRLAPKVAFHLRTQGVLTQATSSKLKKWIFTTTFRNSYVICLSEFLAKDISTVYEKSPIIVNNGIEDFYPGFHRRTSGQKPTILFLSNLSRSKGVFDLIDAFSILKVKGVEFTGLIVGNQGDMTEAQIEVELRKRQLIEEVRLLGPKYGKEKYELLCATDIFVFPTYFEAFPGVVLEAMQFEIPVVSTYEGAIPEIIDEGINGLLVQKQNSNELAEKMNSLINNPEMREALGRNGRCKFVKQYTLEIFEENMKKAFNKILVGY